MSLAKVNIPLEWQITAEQILVHGGPVVVLGAQGVGKSTFCHYLMDFYCRRGGRVAWIDGDPGQPLFGPPGAVSLTYHTRQDGPAKMLAMGFIGDTSPVGHLLEVVSGLQKLSRQARELDPDLVLINTCGLVGGGAARELAFHEIDVLAPQLVVALQRTTEIEHLLAPHAYHAGLIMLRLPVSPEAQVSSREAKQAVREQRFKDYFRGAEFQEISLADVGVHGPGIGTGERLGFRDVNRLSGLMNAIIVHAELSSDRLFLVTEGGYDEGSLLAAREHCAVREVVVYKRSELDHLLVGLNNDRNSCLGLGILREIEFREMTMRVITPLKDRTPIRYLSLGTLKVSPTGAELGRL